MTFPTMTLNRVRVGELVDAAPGSLVGILRGSHMCTGIALGEPGGAASHFLVDEEGMPTVYRFAAIGNLRVLLADAREQLLLDIPTAEFDANRLPGRVGQLALTTEGPMVCASMGTDSFGRHVQEFVCLTSSRLLVNRQELHRGAQWVVQWALLLRDATDVQRRIVGSPAYHDAARLQR